MTTQRKPSFNVSQDGRTVEVDGTVYSLNPQGLRNIPELIKSDFKGFRKPSFNELLSLVHAACENSSIEESKKLIDSFRNEEIIIISNTCLFEFPLDITDYNTERHPLSIVYAIDNPVILGNPEALSSDYLISQFVQRNKEVQSLNGLARDFYNKSHEAIRISSDGQMRAVPNLRLGLEKVFNVPYTEDDELVFLTGNLDSPEKVREICSHIQSNLYLSTGGEYIPRMGTLVKGIIPKTREESLLEAIFTERPRIKEDYLGIYITEGDGKDLFAISGSSYDEVLNRLGHSFLVRDKL
ncbi:MAG: hypothetical protein AABX94_01645 [Nanoarchaeota archaeon]